ncbi:MAG TPA: hypothetical protein PK627_10705 [Bacteroidales bacterium]|nr:hypothetical protein [Bacteroidales bacterium]
MARFKYKIDLIKLSYDLATELSGIAHNEEPFNDRGGFSGFKKVSNQSTFGNNL